MRGYKAFNPDFTCRGFQYEVGKTYKLPEDQKLKICMCGFHFCRHIVDVFAFYGDFYAESHITKKNLAKVRIAEVEALGDIQQEGIKFVTNKIKIIKELTKEEYEWIWKRKRLNVYDDNLGIVIKI